MPTLLISPGWVNRMARIVNLRELATLLPRKSKGRIVLVGGCFDILHIGHVRFLSKARGMGDYLMLLLESDENVKKLKGKNRPVSNQKQRAEVLSSLTVVDLIVLLPVMDNDNDYLNLVTEIKPDVIVLTKGDPLVDKKRLQAKRVGAKLKIIPVTKTFSTSKLAKILGVD